MNLLFVHKYLGAFGGAETNILLTANELSKRGHSSSLLYVEPTGLRQQDWTSTFRNCLRYEPTSGVRNLEQGPKLCAPDALYVNNVNDLTLLEEISHAHLPVLRMVHDHEMYCLRGYKYHPVTRGVCHRRASWVCVFPCGAPLARN